MSYYAPLNVLKPIGEDIWIVDGPDIRFYGLPFSTRMTVIRLKNGDLMLHSPTRPTDELIAAVAALGVVRHLISPNWIHYAYISEWAAAFPEAVAWASPNVRKRAAKKGMATKFDFDLGAAAPEKWAGQVDQMIVEGSRVHREVVFFHRASGTLILTDLIENFETKAVPLWLRPVLRLVGVVHPDGKMPADMWLTFRNRRLELRACVQRMIDWQPSFIVVAHGRCYDRDCEAELRRAFRKAL